MNDNGTMKERYANSRHERDWKGKDFKPVRSVNSTWTLAFAILVCPRTNMWVLQDEFDFGLSQFPPSQVLCQCCRISCCGSMAAKRSCWKLNSWCRVMKLGSWAGIGSECTVYVNMCVYVSEIMKLNTGSKNVETAVSGFHDFEPPEVTSQEWKQPSYCWTRFTGDWFEWRAKQALYSLEIDLPQAA